MKVAHQWPGRAHWRSWLSLQRSPWRAAQCLQHMSGLPVPNRTQTNLNITWAAIWKSKKATSREEKSLQIVKCRPLTTLDKCLSCEVKLLRQKRVVFCILDSLILECSTVRCRLTDRDFYQDLKWAKEKEKVKKQKNKNVPQVQYWVKHELDFCCHSWL